MKKIGIAIFAMLVMVANAMASTQIWGSVSNSGGVTQYSEQTTVAGLDWSEGKTYQTTGVVNFAANNDGQMQLNTYLNNPGEWVLEKYEAVVGTGDSEVYKQMAVWTEDTTLWENAAPQYRNPTGSPGELAYPTKAWVTTSFVTNTMSDDENAYFEMTDVPAEQNVGVFTKLVHTNDLFNFNAAQGIGVEPCQPVSMPQFHPVGICVDC